MYALITLSLALAALLVGCSESSFNGAQDAARGASSTAPPPSAPGESAGTTAPPEDEGNFLALLPAQTDIFVFVANPDRGTVTRVNVRTLAVDTTQVGNDPQVVLTTPDYSTAAIFNRGDDSVTVLDAVSLDGFTVDVRDNFNQMVLSPDGRWVALWHDTGAVRPDDPPAEGLQSFNETSFVDLTTGDHFPMAVGFNPRMVRFTPDGAIAVVVADAYLSVVDLTETPLEPRLIELVPDVLDPPAAEEVVLAPDASFAYVRQFGATDLLVVELATGDVDAVPAGINPTDLDLSPDGTEAVVVARGSQEIWIYDAADPFAGPPTVLPFPVGTVPNFGSLLFDPTGEQAVLYTTATLTERYLTWDRTDDSLRERALVKPVAGFAITPTGESMLAFHTLADGPDTEPTFIGEWAMTLIALDDFRSNPLRLPGEPTGYANSNNGLHGYFIMDGEPYLEVLDYTTLLHEQIPLKSAPRFVGVLPDLDLGDDDEPQAWVSQEHDLGRISFFDPDDDSLETITGFELNSEIE